MTEMPHIWIIGSWESHEVGDIHAPIILTNQNAESSGGIRYKVLRKANRQEYLEFAQKWGKPGAKSADDDQCPGGYYEVEILD